LAQVILAPGPFDSTLVYKSPFEPLNDMYYSVALLLFLGSEGLHLKSKVQEGLTGSPGAPPLGTMSVFGEVTSQSTAGGVRVYGYESQKNQQGEHTGLYNNDFTKTIRQDHTTNPSGVSQHRLPTVGNRLLSDVDEYGMVDGPQANFIMDPPSAYKGCSDPMYSFRPDCVCPFQEYFACKGGGSSCKDMFGYCDPARKPTSVVVESFSSTPQGLGASPTCEVTVGKGNKKACKESFVADFLYKGDSCVCYEPAINTPSRPDVVKMGLPVSYEKNMLAGHKMGFPYLYSKSKIEQLSCQDRGIVFDKKVHPCMRHAYTAFRNTPCQNAYRVHRSQQIKSHEYAVQAALTNIYQEMLNPSHPLTVTQGMYAGQCNTGQ